MELIDLIKKEFRTQDRYHQMERTVQRSKLLDDNIILEVYKSNKSSIYYNYEIDMNCIIT